MSDIVATWEEVAATRSRRAKVHLLAACLRGLSPGERVAGASFLSGEPAQGRIGVGWATLAGATPQPALAPGTLTVADADAALRRVAAASGRGSRGERAGVLGDLLGRATAAEQRFLQSMILQDLRQGALEGVLVEAVAAAAGAPAAEVRRALMVHGHLGEVAAAALEGGIPALRRFTLTLFRPVQPMLAQTAADLNAALSGMGRVGLEAKIDGARIQVHRQGERVAVFTRTGREITASVPEIVAAVLLSPAGSLILDGEAVALRPDGRPYPFQATMSRFGTRGGPETAGALRLTPLFFDCLHCEGTDLIAEAAEARWEALHAQVGAGLLVAHIVTDSPDAAAAFLGEVLGCGHEGVLAKDPSAPYEAGRRGASWLKVKPVLTLDLVVLGAEWGYGRRQGWLSNLHLGAHDPASGGFVMLGKTFKGLTDDMLAWQTERLLALEAGRDGQVVVVRPELVVEVAFDGVQASPRYPGGVTLRFARVKGYRPDRRAAEADTIDTVRRIGGFGDS